MFFSKKPSIKFIKFRPEELKDRIEWLFWSSLINTNQDLENLKRIFDLDDYKWTFLKKDFHFETLLWLFGNSVVVLKEKLLTEEQIEDLTSDLIFWLTVIFPNYKSYQIIDIFANYILLAKEQKDHKKLHDELESYFISRICSLFKLEGRERNNPEIRDHIFMRFPYGLFGWTLALDAFSSVEIKQIKAANTQARQIFRGNLLRAKEKIETGETEEEKLEREKWEQVHDEFYRLVKELKSSLEEDIERGEKLQNNLSGFFLNADIEKPLRDQLLDWAKKEKLSLSDTEVEKLLERAKEFLVMTELPRRRQTEKSLRKFLLQIDAQKPIKEQIIGWIEKERLYLSDREIEKFVEMAHDKQKESESNESRKKFFGNH